MGTADGRVLANSQIWGGMGGQAAKSCVATGWENVAIHEMGHSLFGLADEYEYFRGCGGETDHDYFPELPGIRIEAAEPNITVFGGSGGKWADLIASGTPPPTTSNANCRVCDPQASPVPSGTVGTFEGAGNYHCKIFRPEFNCMMRVTGRPFCAVCRRRIRETIAPYHQIGMSLAPLRVRRIHDYAWLNGFAGGFPNFNEADYGRGLVYGSVLLQPGASERREVAATELGSPDALNLEQCFRAVHDYATANGFVGGFPIFHQADYGQGLVYGCVLVNAAAGEWRDVPANGLCVRPKRLNDAQFVSQAVPAKLSAGEAKPVSVKLRNTGAATWTATAAHRLGAQDPEDNLLWG